MNNSFYVLILLFSVFISSISQVFLKKAALEKHESFIREYLNLKVIVAYFLFFAAVFIDLYGLKFVPASYIPVIETSSYFFVMIWGVVFFKERFRKVQILAVAMILAGIFIYVV